LVEISAF